MEYVNETERENLDNLGKRQGLRGGLYRNWHLVKTLGGLCEECGGTGRSENGCQPCYVCDNGRI
jgi:hypothetical protein